jgi:hypothetical protein
MRSHTTLSVGLSEAKTTFLLFFCEQEVKHAKPIEKSKILFILLKFYCRKSKEFVLRSSG